MAVLEGSIQLRQVTSSTASSSTEVPLNGQPVLVTMPDGKFRMYRGDGSTQLQTLYSGQKYLPTNEAILTLLSAYLETTAVDTDPTLAANSNALVPSQQAVLTLVNDRVAGVDWKAAVRVRTTANITLSGTQTIDGVALSVGDRVLVMNQTTGTQNGIYVVAAGAWARSDDASTGDELAWSVVTVMEGTVHATTRWHCNTYPITLGSTNVSWTSFGGGTYTADNVTLRLTGSQFSIKDDGVGENQLGDALLKALVPLTTAANKGLYFTAADTPATFDLDAFSRGLLNAADETTWRRNLKTLYNNWVAVTGDTTLIASDAGKVHSVTTSSATITVTLPSASGVAAGTTMVVRKANSDGYTVVTSPATETLRAADDMVVLVSDGTNWKVMQRHSATEMTAYKTSDQNTSSTSLTDVTDLSLPMEANADYQLEAVLLHGAAATTTGSYFSVNGPASPNRVGCYLMSQNTGGVFQFRAINAYDGGSTTASSDTTTVSVMHGVIRNGSNAGNLVVRFAAEVAAQITCHQGSYITLKRIR